MSCEPNCPGSPWAGMRVELSSHSIVVTAFSLSAASAAGIKFIAQFEGTSKLILGAIIARGKPGSTKQTAAYVLFYSPDKTAGRVFSASIHKSYDGTKVVNYAQWKSREDSEAMTRHPDAIPHMKSSASMARFDPIPMRSGGLDRQRRVV